MSQSVYQLEIGWECECDNEIFVRHPEMKEHPVIEEKALNTRDVFTEYRRRS